MILVADDHDDSRSIAREVLELSGHIVAEASNGTDAMLLARSLHPDLLLLDLRLPDVDGWSVARTLRRQPDTADLVIIAFSACVRATDRERAIAAGCNAFLPKPIRPRDLVEAVNAWMTSARP